MSEASLGDGYLRAEDLIRDGNWSEVVYTIEEIFPPKTIKSADGKVIDKYILSFQETGKRLVLGGKRSIKFRYLQHETGASKASELVGKSITLHPVIGNWLGQKNVTAIRVRVTGNKPKPYTKPADYGKDITGKTVGENNG